MKKQLKTLHIFGGGVFVGIAERIAHELGWEVIVRTGKRFIDTLHNLDVRTKLFVGDDLDSLMKQGGVPKRGDYGISFSAPWIFPQEVIDYFDGEIFNLHNQPLPKFRGGGGTSWTILMRERLGGCCIHRLVRKIDAGDIFARCDFFFPESLEFPIDFDRYIANHSKNLLIEWLPKLLTERSPGEIVDINESESEYWPRLNTNIHGWIDWSWGIDDIYSFCKAFSNPHSGAKTLVNNCIIELKKISICETKKFHPYQTGLIFRISDGLYVAHRNGVLRVHKYRLANPKAKVTLGDRLFTPRDLLETALLQRIQYSPSGKVSFR